LSCGIRVEGVNGASVYQGQGRPDLLVLNPVENSFRGNAAGTQVGKATAQPFYRLPFFVGVSESHPPYPLRAYIATQVLVGLIGCRLGAGHENELSVASVF